MLGSVGVGEAATAEAGLEFEDLFRAEYGRLAGALQLLTGDRDEAEELAQEALSRVYERWDRVRVMASPDGYLYRIALNLSRKRWRSLARRPSGGHPREDHDPALTVERRVVIRQALMSLTPDQREALVLVEWLGFPPAEAARALGISPESVRARLHRAREGLQKRFGGGDV